MAQFQKNFNPSWWRGHDGNGCILWDCVTAICLHHDQSEPELDGTFKGRPAPRDLSPPARPHLLRPPQP